MEKKDKTTAILLALFLGGIGAHKFYLKQNTQGIFYAIFFWTFIPAIIAFVEFIILATMTNAAFDEKYNSEASEPAKAKSSLHYTEELEKLNELKVKGILTEDEFNSKKRIIMSKL